MTVEWNLPKYVFSLLHMCPFKGEKNEWKKKVQMPLQKGKGVNCKYLTLTNWTLRQRKGAFIIVNKGISKWGTWSKVKRGTLQKKNFTIKRANKGNKMLNKENGHWSGMKRAVLRRATYLIREWALIRRQRGTRQHIKRVLLRWKGHWTHL